MPDRPESQAAAPPVRQSPFAVLDVLLDLLRRSNRSLPRYTSYPPGRRFVRHVAATFDASLQGEGPDEQPTYSESL